MLTQHISQMCGGQQEKLIEGNAPLEAGSLPSGDSVEGHSDGRTSLSEVQLEDPNHGKASSLKTISSASSMSQMK